MKFRFEGDNMKPVDNPDMAEMLSLLDTLHPTDRCFFSLAEVSTGSYVQAAGARLRLTVEARLCEKGGFRHYVLGTNPRNERTAYINCRVGPIHVMQSQMLVLDDARKIFARFLKRAELIKSYDLQDVTSRFPPG
ncbi:MAG: hypothetical protein ACLFQB_08720 [Chitinispirillaceae bacterium]